MTVIDLPRPAPSAVADPLSAVAAQTWSVDPHRCAAAVSMPRTPWRARLRVLGGRVCIDEGGSIARVNAVLSPRALYSTMPTAHRWFLPEALGTHRLMIVADGIAAPHGTGLRITTIGKAWTADRAWTIPMQIRLRPISDERAVLEVLGRVRCRPYTVLFDLPVRIEAAAEVIRCA